MRSCTQHPIPPHPQWMAQVHQPGPKDSQHFCDIWNELSIKGGVMLKDDHIFTPPKLFNRILADLHCHQGTDKCNSSSEQQCIGWYWCRHCQLCQKMNTLHEAQGDLAGTANGTWKGHCSWLLHSQWKRILANTQHLQQICIDVQSINQHSPLWARKNRIWSPTMDLQENLHWQWTPFSSEVLAKYLQKWKIDHITSSCLYPQLNGFITRQVKTVKTLLNTIQVAGTPSVPFS